MKTYATISFSILILLCSPAYAFGEQPIDVIQKFIDQGIHILQDPQYQDQSQRLSQRQKLMETLAAAFDYNEFSRRVLANSWRMFSPPQREEFTMLFARFINLYYIPKLQDKYNNEKVVVMAQDMISPIKAVVRIKVFWKNREVPVEIKMIRHSETWKAFDLSALGISAVSFYRAQFRAILQKRSPAQVIEMIREKVRLHEMKSQN
jgi:phospholipid transport system substrate-binding protein